MLEFALSLPLLILMALGTADFGRLFFHAVATTAASAAGAFFGGQGNIRAVDPTGMADTATNSVPDLGSVSGTGTHYCDCPDDPVSGPDDTDKVVDCISAVCPVNGYGMPRLFVRMQSTYVFQTVNSYPGVPAGTQIVGSSFMRVQ